MGFWLNGIFPQIRTVAAFQEREIIQQPFVIKATNRGVNILDHVLMKAFWISLQSFKEMKGLGSIFNFYCGQAEIRDEEIMLRFGSLIK